MSKKFYQTGYNSKNFMLDLSVLDTSNVTDKSYMFYQTGYNNTDFVTSINITNPSTNVYNLMFRDVATKGNSKITVNYTTETSDLVDKMIATKSSSSNVVKGVQVD